MAPPMEIMTKYGLPPCLVAMPVYGGRKHFTRGCMDELWMHANDKKIPIFLQYEYGCSLVPRARNKIVESFLKDKNLWYLLMIDSDMMFPPDIYERLLIHDKDITGAVCVKKVPPHYPTIADEVKPGVYRYLTEFPRDKIFKVGRLGLAITLFKRKVFETIPKPWFSCPVNAKGDDIVGEDYAFNDLCKKYGIETWADPMMGERCFHIGDYPFGLRDFEAQLTVGNVEKDIRGELYRSTNFSVPAAEAIPKQFAVSKPVKWKAPVPNVVDG